jgi:hypothetical protein
MVFDLFYGGYFADNLKAIYKDGFLCCSWPYGHFPDPEFNYRINLEGNENWEALLQFLKTCRWIKEYPDPGILDGIQWKLKVRTPEFKLSSGGSNAYPGNFDAFLELLEKVTAPAGLNLIYRESSRQPGK